MTQITATQNTTPSGFCARQTKLRTPILHLAIGVSARTLSKVAPKLAALWRARIFVTPRKFPRPDREKHWMAAADSRWAKIESGTPVLMFHDKKDRMVPYSEGQTNAARWPGAELIATEGLGHARILRDQDVIRAAIRFLAVQRAVQLFQ